MSSIIRKVETSDFEALFALVAEFTTSFTPERESFEQSAKALLTDEAAWLTVAEHEGEVIGYCLGFDHFTFYANGRVAWVEEIMVTADYRQQGIGRNLMLGFEAWAKERGSKLVALATRRAATFYLALGYEDSATYFRKLL
ncbi:MAG: GNAT family N-acetyltransferase [Anaerolineae bacterium]|nr:GNAT family N-acetyltransferase [Anaerolineae bacterium]